ncbi:MAG: FABP family protein [Salinibacterium sp.]|nr:MAG: FABP family protein [Salinibacterium sp.]
MIELDASIPAELAPLSWLIGLWEGTGVVSYEVGDEMHRLEFGQRLSFTHDGLPHLNYSSYTWLLDENQTPHVTETGYWRLSRPAAEGDPGPGMLKGVGEAPYRTAESVEALRNADDAFDIEVSIVHPGGVNELYIGQVKGPRIDLATDAVLRTGTAKEYAAATRIYGLVEGHLLWAWDIAALGQELKTHASGRLARVE